MVFIINEKFDVYQIIKSYFSFENTYSSVIKLKSELHNKKVHTPYPHRDSLDTAYIWSCQFDH